MLEKLNKFLSRNVVKPVRNANGIEIGDPGNFKLWGVFYDEYNDKLAGLRGIETYDEMRSDATVAATLLSMELPIRATKWHIEPGKTNGEVTDQDLLIKEFIEKALFEKLEGSFDDLLRQALSMLTFGFSAFEKVYKIEDNAIYLKKLSPRLQKTVDKWEMENGKPGLTQILNTDTRDSTVSIPAEKLVVFTYRKEGNNPEGRSVLRNTYKNWYYKDNLYSFEGVKHERASVWIPILTLPKGASESDKSEAEKILRNLRAASQQYVILPSEDWKFEFADLKNGTTSDPGPAIQHHNREIAKSILAQFLELWQDTGSYSLSKDQTSLFMLGLAAVANQFKDVVNKDIVKELVGFNFEIKENQTLPKLSYEKLGEIDFTEISESISKFVDKWVLTIDNDLEDYVRDTFELPKKIRNAAEEKAGVTKIKPVDDKKPKEKEKVEKQEEVEKEKLEANYSEGALEFAEDVKLDVKVADKIIKFLNATKPTDKVDIQDFGIVLGNLKYKLRAKINIVKLLNKATDKEVKEVISELVEWRNPNALELKKEYPSQDYESKEYAEMQDLRENRQIFNYLDILNVQNQDK